MTLPLLLYVNVCVGAIQESPAACQCDFAEAGFQPARVPPIITVTNVGRGLAPPSDTIDA